MHMNQCFARLKTYINMLYKETDHGAKRADFGLCFSFSLVGIFRYLKINRSKLNQLHTKMHHERIKVFRLKFKQLLPSKCKK